MKKIITTIVGLLTLVVLGVGCKNSDEPLRLGTMPTYSAAIYAVGIEKGFFKEAGVDVNLRVFRSALDRDSAATAGELDGFMTDIMGAINLNAKGFPFLMTSSEFEDFAVISVNNGDKSNTELPKIGISENTVMEFIVDEFLDKEVTKVNMLALPDRMGALLSGELDYAVFPQPFSGIVISKGGEVVFTTANENFNPVVLVFDETYMKEQGDLVEAFYKGYIKTVQYMQSREYNEYKEALVIHTLATAETVDLYRLPVDYYGLHIVDENSFVAIKTWMEEKQLFNGDMEFGDIYTSKFVK